MAHTITKMVLFMRVNGKVICQTVMEWSINILTMVVINR
jgi:hypothetical protein